MKLSRLSLIALVLFVHLCQTLPCAAALHVRAADTRAAFAAQNAGGRADDAATLRALIDGYFAAYAARDLNKFVAFWSEKSTGREVRRAEVEKQFVAATTATPFHIKGVLIESLRLEGGAAAAQARVGLELRGADAKTGQSAPGASRHEWRALAFVKESGAWKIARDVSAADEVAASLFTAKDEATRAAILAAETNVAAGELLQPTLRIANRLFVESDYEGALAAYELVRELAARANNPRGLALALMGQGLVHNARDESDLALAAYAKSLSAAEAAKDPATIARALNNIGNVYYKRGDFATALANYGRSLELQQSAGNELSVAQTVNNIGSIYYEQRDYEQAREYFARSLSLAEKVGDKRGAANTLNNLGDIAREGGDFAKALDYYGRSLAASESINFKLGVARALNNLGGVYLYQSNAPRALEYLRRSLALYESVGEKHGLAIANYNVGRAFFLIGDRARSLDHAARAISLGHEAGNQKAVAQAQTLTGDLLLATGRGAAAARRAFEDAIANTEQMRADAVGGETERQRFFENKTAPYESMIKLLAANGEPAEAFAYAERAKARVLLDVLQGGRHDVTKSMTVGERADEQRLRGEITHLNQQVVREGALRQPDAARLAAVKTELARARLGYEAFRTALYAAHPALREQRGESRQPSAAESAALLPDDRSAALEFAVTDDTTYLFVLTRAAGKPVLKVYPIAVKRSDISARAETFRQLLAGRGLGFREAAAQFYDLLLKPAARDLDGKTSLIVVPDAGLWNVPLQALVSGSGRYLVEDFAISYVSSLAVLGGAGRVRHSGGGVRSNPQQLLAFGNPTDFLTNAGVPGAARQTSLAPLPEAEREVKTLGRLYGAAHSKVFSGAEASEAHLKAEVTRYAVVHLASHGILDAANPMYSRIVLAGGDSAEDGLLETWELMQMDLRANLFVLSACETARGRVGAGEGLIGMSWALFVAGVPTVVVSNWKVSSSSTTELMLNFHRNLKAGGRGANAPMAKAEALRRASLSLLNSPDYRHPFYWAGFSLFGDGR